MQVSDYVSTKMVVSSKLFFDNDLVLDHALCEEEISFYSSEAILFLSSNPDFLKCAHSVLLERVEVVIFVDSIFKHSEFGNCSLTNTFSRQDIINNISALSNLYNSLGSFIKVSDIIKKSLILLDILSLRSLLTKRYVVTRDIHLNIKKEVMFKVNDFRMSVKKFSKVSAHKFNVSKNNNITFANSIDSISKVIRRNRSNPTCREIPVINTLLKYINNEINLIGPHELSKLGLESLEGSQFKIALYMINNNITKFYNQPYFDWRLRIYSESLGNITFNKCIRSLLKDENCSSLVKGEVESHTEVCFNHEIRLIKPLYEDIINEKLLVYIYLLLFEVGKAYKKSFMDENGTINIDKMVIYAHNGLEDGTLDLTTLSDEETILHARISKKIKMCKDRSCKIITTDIFIYRDAMASGVQNMTRILGASDDLLSNLNLGGNRVTDPYTYIINMYKRSKNIENTHLNRKNLKKTIMTIFYSAGEKTTSEYFMKSVDTNGMNVDQLKELKEAHKNFYKWLKNEKVFKISQKEYIEMMMNRSEEHMVYKANDGVTVDLKYFVRRKVDLRLKINIIRKRMNKWSYLSEIYKNELIKVLITNIERTKTQGENEKEILEKLIESQFEMPEKDIISQDGMEKELKILKKKFVLYKYRKSEMVKKNGKLIIDRRKTKGGLIANIMHTEDAYIIRQLLSDLGSKSTLIVHDCIIFEFGKIEKFIKSINKIYKTKSINKNIWM